MILGALACVTPHVEQKRASPAAAYWKPGPFAVRDDSRQTGKASGVNAKLAELRFQDMRALGMYHFQTKTDRRLN